jgi:aspartyl-tRNA(Asn)/glutamyl-tRNA(Gln) amidotransferase subunit A
MSYKQFTELGAIELARLIRSGNASTAEVADAFIAAVEDINPGINAIVRHDPAKIRAEAEHTGRRLRDGDPAPLLGVPFTVKDCLWVKGETISMGSALYANFVAPEDAIEVARMRMAGGIVLGITNCSEFACKGVTTNKLFGPTLNPWDLSRTTGGSSGGSAAAVSAGLGPIALCTDAGGSARRPAAHSGTVGFKPSGGLLAHTAGFKDPAFYNATAGVITRRVADAAAATEAMAGPSPHDPLTRPYDPAFSAAEISEASVKGLQIAFSPRLGLGFSVDPGVAKSVANAVDALAERGAHVEIHDPHWPEGTSEEALMPLQFAGLAALYGEEFRRDPNQFDPDIAVQIERGLTLTAVDFAGAMYLRNEMFNVLVNFFERFDLLVTPTTPVTAWQLPHLGPSTIEGKTVAARAHAVFTPLFNHTFVPAISVPCGLVDGLPVGIHVIGRRFEDTVVLRAAQAIEHVFGAPFVVPHSLDPNDQD